MHLTFQIPLLYGKERHTKELECLEKTLLDVSFDKVIKFGVFCVWKKKRKKDVKDVSSVRQVDVFHFHGLPSLFSSTCCVCYLSYFETNLFYFANVAENVANSFK